MKATTTKQSVSELIENIYQTNDVSFADILATTTLSELNGKTTLQEVFEVIAESYNEYEGDEVIRINADDELVRNVATNEDVDVVVVYENNNPKTTKATTVGELIRHLNGYTNQDSPIAYTLWGANDVIGKAEENDIKLTDEEVNEVLYRIEKQHDCEYGINWDNVNDNIIDVVNERDNG